MNDDEECGGRWNCVLPRGHNMGKLDIPVNHESRKPYRKPWVAPRRGGYAPEPSGVENPQPPEGAATVALRNYELWNAVEIEANAKSTANRLCARWEFKNWVRADRTPTRRQDFLDGAIAGYLAAKGIEE